MGYLGKQLAKNSPWLNFCCWTVLTTFIVVYIMSETTLAKGILVAILGVLWICCVAVGSWKQSYFNKYKKEPELTPKQQGIIGALYVSCFILLIVALIILFL